MTPDPVIPLRRASCRPLPATRLGPVASAVSLSAVDAASATVRVAGALSRAASVIVCEVLTGLAATGRTRLRVEVAGVESVDAAALDLLADFARTSHCSLHVGAFAPEVRDALVAEARTCRRRP